MAAAAAAPPLAHGAADATADGHFELLSGWGRTPRSGATVHRVAAADEAQRLLMAAGPRGALPRGLARSYGDAAQNAGGHVLDMTAADRVLAVDLPSAEVEVEAGISLDRLMNLFVPLGMFVPVTAGTRYVTVGGAIAADIHGKNHHIAGSSSRRANRPRVRTDRPIRRPRATQSIQATE